MQKSKLGVSVGLLAALLCFSAIFGGYTIPVLIAGYILIAEENSWLKKTAVKVITLMVAFWLISALVGLIPGAIGVIDSLVSIFDGHFYISFISNLVSFINVALNFAEKLLFLFLGFKALNQGTVNVPVIDNFINKYMD